MPLPMHSLLLDHEYCCNGIHMDYLLLTQRGEGVIRYILVGKEVWKLRGKYDET